MRYSIALVSALIFSGCVTQELQTPQNDKQVVYDLVSLEQNISAYTQNSKITPFNSSQLEYEKSYFLPWNLEKPEKPLEEIQWAFKAYSPENSYGENLQSLGQNFFDAMYKNANFDKYATVNKNAITLRHLNIRAFPTQRPLLLDPSKAGEGFPFDYLQNSTISANKPIFISHYSLDGEWAHIFSSFTHGWVKSNDIVVLGKKYTDRWQNAQQVFFTKENQPVYAEDGRFLFKSKIGIMLPLIEESDDYYTILTISSLKASDPLYEKVKISKKISHKGALAFTKDNLENIVNEVSKTNYGWGGMYEQRDCSSMLRDLYAPFGVWLPRNSYKQAQIGEVISFDGLNDDQKRALIMNKAIPFKTLLYKKGHIMLYIGSIDKKIIIFHNTWGIKTIEGKKEGRLVIGKPIFSTLQLGKEQKNYDIESELLRNLKSMNTLDF